jgi:hypothetical protein
MTIEQVFKNKDLIIAKKKNAIKKADVVYNVVIDENTKSEAVKLETGEVPDPTVINAKLVINTTNIIDSHMDCHIKGIWNKSLSELKQVFLLQEHEMEFDKIICDSLSDKLTVGVENKTFKSLGLDLPGSGEALIFNAEIKKDVNPFMFDLYKKGRVNQHSVGMRYVKMFLCVNKSEAMFSQEKENWDKYYPQVANKEVADEKGYFWAVTEAKIVEGSAVVKGSNFATPTLEIDITEAVNNTSENEPSNDTQKQLTHLFI